MIKILIVDDQIIIRQGLRSLLTLSNEVEVIGEAASGDEALKWCEETQPDIILMDIQMPVLDGIETIKRIRKQGLNVPVIMLTTFYDQELILQSVQAGARGYLLKDVELDVLVKTIKDVHAGKSHVYSYHNKAMPEKLGKFSFQEQSHLRTEPLTHREQEILRLVVAGLSNKEIAEAMFKSEGTIKNHLTTIMSKLGVRDRTQASLKALFDNLI